MNYALIRDNKVVNIIVADEGFIDTIKAEYDSVVNVVDTSVGIGWLFDGESFVQPEPFANTVPVSVSMRQFKLALLKKQKLNQISTVINGLPSPEKEEAEIEWEYATTIQTDNTVFSMILDVLELDKEEFFTFASQM
jgi:hypothetical protein